VSHRTSISIGLAAALAGIGVVLAGENTQKKDNQTTANAPQESTDMTSQPTTAPQAAGKRSAQLHIDVKASPAAVWKTLTDAEEITRWFPLHAKVTPGKGGSILTSWGQGQEWDSPITIWEPEKRLRVLWCPPNTPEADLFGVDYFIEPQSGGVTRLRLVHFGFSAEPAWDEMYDGVSQGWDCMLWCLKNYLEQHLGTPRSVVYLRANLPEGMDRPGAWKRLFSAEGLITDPALAALPVGRPFRARVGRTELSGTVRFNRPQRNFQVVLSNMSDALLCIQVYPCHGGPGEQVSAMVSAFGADPARLEEIRMTWADRLARLFGSESTIDTTVKR